MKLMMSFICMVCIALLLCVCDAAKAKEAKKTSAPEPDQDEMLPSKILEASVNSDVAGLQRAVTSGENIDTLNVNGWSAAMLAVANGDMTYLQETINLGINLNLVNNDGLSPLMVAASQSDKEMVEILLAGNASPLIKNEKGDSAYSLAMDSGRKLVALMIAEAAVIHGIDMDDSAVQLEYLKHGAYIDIRNGAGYTPLISAASKGGLDTVNELIKMKADCNRVEQDGWSALHFAAVRGDVKMVDALLKANAAPGIVSVDGRTARMIAETNNFKDVVKLIPDVVEMSV